MSQEKALILVVEDEAELRDMLASEIEAAGMRVITAENGVVGYEKVVTNTPDLVLCDIMMPEMNGFDFLWRVRNENHELDMMPIIFLSALGDTSDKIAALGLGVDDYITKPFEFSLLIPQIWARLNQIRRIKAARGEGLADKYSATPVTSAEGVSRVAAVCSRNHDHAKQVAAALEANGYSVFETMSGEDLLSALPEKVPEVVFLSYLTRDVAGFYVASRIKQITDGGLKVILIGDPDFPITRQQLPDSYDDLIYPASAAEDIERIQQEDAAC